MKLSFLLFAVCLCSCRKDPPIDRNCDLEYLDGLVYEGFVSYCNASGGGQQLSIDARATINVKDSFFILTLVDIDSLYDYNLIDTALVECVYWEGNENYKLHPPINHPGDEIGLLNTEGISLHWKIFKEPCSGSTFFTGRRE